MVMTGLVCLLAFTSCSRERRKILSIAREYSSEDSASWEERAGDIKKTIRMYEGELEKKVKASEYLGEYYKTLASLYMNKQMYGEAVINLQEAIKIYPENPVLFYLAGVCQARMGKAITDPEGRMESFKQAESYYQRALYLNKNHGDSLYGLSVLYIFELEEPWLAKPLLERLINDGPSRNDGRFLLARVYMSEGNTEDAVTIYDEIIKKPGSPEQKTMAEENKRQILEGAYGR